ncbi:hypothetical protein [Haloarchaeobius amylolyticus]|uniref:hypothetical protein n=1 Tax=Haloarchaeobius amylolyticus TaxID=1198296 RepID=UPI00227204CD|nr:hypothetical protein [Haloarchaeobius amylolyticus]
MSTADDIHDRLAAVSTTDVDEQRLVSFAVRPGTPIGEARRRIEEAHTEAEQLDRDAVSEPTREALEATRHVLDDYDETPSNGLAVYAGIVDGDTVIHTFDDLTAPVSGATLERDAAFDVEPLGVTTDTETYGLLVVEHGKAAIGRTAGDSVEHVTTMESDTTEDNPMEGSLEDREEVRRDFFESVAERAGVVLMDEDPDDDFRAEAAPGEPDADPVVGLFVGGSSVTATEFLEQEYLDHRLQERVLADAVAVGEATEAGLEELAAKTHDRREATERERVETRLDRLFAALESDEAAVVGEEGIDEALEYEAAETVLAVDSMAAETRRLVERRTVEQGGEFVVVPDEADGHDRLADAGGVGAILRFPVE